MELNEVHFEQAVELVTEKYEVYMHRTKNGKDLEYRFDLRLFIAGEIEKVTLPLGTKKLLKAQDRAKTRFLYVRKLCRQSLEEYDKKYLRELQDLS